MKSNKLKKIRKEKGVTIKELAEKTGISMGYISHLENGSRSNPSKKVMEKISKALEETIVKIFF